MNKTRSTDKTIIYWSQYDIQPPTFIPGQTACVFSESFIDSGRHKVDNSCYHVKTVSDYDYLIQGYYKAPPLNTGQQFGLGYRAATLGTWAQPLLFSYQSPVFDIHSLSAAAFTAMRPTMTSGLSLSNFLFELRDMKSLFSLWNRHKSVLTNAAAGHLNYSFGWRPLFSDLKKIFECIGNFEARLHDLINRAGSEQVRKYRSTASSADVTSYYYDELYSGHMFKVVTSFSEIIFCAKMCYAYSLPTMSRSELTCRAALDALGLNVNPSQIWDAIPFSFLVDWFANVGAVLESWNRNWLRPVLDVRSMMYSILVECTTKVYVFPWYRQYPTQSEHWELGSQHEVSHYTRSWGMPVIDYDLELGYPATYGKIALGASLFQTLRR